MSLGCAHPLRAFPWGYRRCLRGLLVPVLFFGCLSLGGSFDQHSPLPPAALPGEGRDSFRDDIGGRGLSLISRARVALPEDAEAWKRLPPALRGANQPLPAWARALAASLPRTTAAMLELDFLHRARGPLNPALAARLRWVAARANNCRYGQAYAEADLRRAGVSAAAIRDLADDPLAGPDSDALVFAHQLTRAANTITDAEVARLIGRYGEKQVVAMVLLLAYANFQDRLILALDLPLEGGGPLPPLDVAFKPAPFGARLAAPRTAVRSAAANPEREADAEWLGLAFPDLQKGMERQRCRPPRINLPPQEAEGPLWGLVCKGYQPELAGAWSACARAFEAEADQDAVFEQSLFWVVTRSLQCFY